MDKLTKKEVEKLVDILKDFTVDDDFEFIVGMLCKKHQGYYIVFDDSEE